MAEKETEERRYQLSIHFQPWWAILEPLDHTEDSGGRTEKFNSPLELLEHLEKDASPPKGLK